MHGASAAMGPYRGGAGNISRPQRGTARVKACLKARASFAVDPAGGCSASVAVRAAVAFTRAGQPGIKARQQTQPRSHTSTSIPS